MKISVCMATYNGEMYIKEQLESILCQIGEEDEIIISDDGSTDGTLEIIKSFADKRIRLFENQNFKSPVYNFENALKFSSGQFIFLADQDDLWLPNKVKKMKEMLTKYDLVLSDAIVVDENKVKIHDSFFYLNGVGKGILRNIRKNSYLGCAMAFNREILNKALPFPKNLPMHDWWLGLVAEVYGSTYMLNVPLILYRRHGGNASASGEVSKYSFGKKLGFRLTIINKLLFRVFL